MLKRFINYIKRTEIVQHASLLVGGTVIAQAIPILLQPFLRRFFPPETFGVYSVYISIIGILMVVACFRYEQAIVLPKRDSDASALVIAALFFSLIFSIIILLVAIIFKSWLIPLLNLTDDQGYILYLVPLGTFLLSAFQVFNYWLIRKKGFMPIAINKFSRRIVEGFTQSVFALARNTKGLVLGDVAGQITNFLVSMWQSFQMGFSIKKFSLIRLKYLLNKYIDFPRYSLIPSLMSTASYLLPVVFINKHFTSQQAGYFDLTKLILSVPLALVAGSFSSVVLNRVSDSFRNRRPIFNELRPLIVMTLVISFFEIIVITLFGETLFVFIFGEQWVQSGQIAKILVWPFALNFITSSFTSVFVALNKIIWQSIWQLFYFTLIVSLIFFSHLMFHDFIVLYTIFEIIANTSMIVLLVIVIKKYEIRIS